MLWQLCYYGGQSSGNKGIALNDLLEAALKYASQGWPVFPCRADKTPFLDNGVLGATTDLDTIKGWWQRWPHANIGMDVGSAHMMVYDFDPGHDLNELQANVGTIPKTALRQRTPRGGYHWFYEIDKSELVMASASKVAENVDVRSFHSYVLLAPSRTEDGLYVWEEQGRPAFRTDEMVRTANIAKERDANHDTWLIEPDRPEHIEQAIEWLERDAKIAVQGKGGDSCAYATAAMMKSFGISSTKAFELIWDHWNSRCIPPWGANEYEHLQAKVEHAYEYNKSPPGNMTKAYHSAKLQALFPKKVQIKTASKGTEFYEGKFRFANSEAIDCIEPPEWLIPDLLPAGAYAMIYGPPSAFKSFVALDIAMTVATGMPMHPNWICLSPGPVLFALGEGRPGMKARRNAWQGLHWGGERVANFNMVDPVPTIVEQPDDFIKGALRLSPEGYRLIVIDTVSRSMQGANENAQEHASTFTALVSHIQSMLGNPTVLALHHTGAEQEQRARGSSVFRGDVDTMLRLERVSNQACKLHMVKQKDSPEWTDPRSLRVTDYADSLVIVPPAYGQTPEEAKAEEVKQQAVVEHKKTTEVEKVVRKSSDIKRVETAAIEILAGNRSEWTHKALAEAISVRTGIPANTIRTGDSNLLARVREDLNSPINKMFVAKPTGGTYKYQT